MKHSFAEEIKQSSHFLTNPGHSNPITTIEKGVTPTQTLMLLKKSLGQSPKNPQTEKFHYSEKQKSILMKYFEEEEQTGIKRAPEQVISVKINSYKVNKAYQFKLR